MRRLLALAALFGLTAIVACDTADRELPSVSIVSPADGATVDKGDIVIKVLAADNKGVSKVEFSIDGTLAGTISTPGAGDTFQYTWSDTAAQVVGHSYGLVAKAYDAADNSRASSIVTVTIAGGGGPEPTHHSGQIDTNEIWYPSGNPHIIDSDVYTGDSVTLAIMPGCIVECSTGAGLYTGYTRPGSIVAVGTADSVIIFTSASDTAPGAWKQLSFYHNTMSTARLSYVNVECAGGSGSSGAVYVGDCLMKIDHCTLRKSATVGVYCGPRGHFDDFTDNTIVMSGSYPIRIDAEHVKTLGTGNTLNGNARDGILVQGGNIATTGTWLNHGVPYVINGDIEIADATSNPVITIAAGTTVQMMPQGEFRVGDAAPGGLICDGTAGRIVFTSSAPPPNPGQWNRLSFYPQSVDSQCKLINCKVEYAGYDGFGNIYIGDCNPTITGDSIGNSLHYGIWLTGDTLNLPEPSELRANNTFYNNVDGDIREP